MEPISEQKIDVWLAEQDSIAVEGRDVLEAGEHRGSLSDGSAGRVHCRFKLIDGWRSRETSSDLPVAAAD